MLVCAEQFIAFSQRVYLIQIEDYIHKHECWIRFLTNDAKIIL